MWTVTIPLARCAIATLFVLASITVSHGQPQISPDQDEGNSDAAQVEEGIIFGLLVNFYFNSAGDAVDLAKAPKIGYSIYSAKGEATPMRQFLSAGSNKRRIAGDNSQSKTLFTMRLPAGKYYFSRISAWSEGQNMIGLVNIPYSVAAGKATYVGSLQAVFFGSHRLFGDVLSNKFQLLVVDEYEEASKMYEDANPDNFYELERDIARPRKIGSSSD